MIVLDDENLRFLALTMLLSRLEHGDLAALRDAGMNDSQMQRLRTMPASEMVRLCSIKSLKIGIAVDEDSLDHAMQMVNRIREEMLLLEKFIERHAPLSMLTELFGVQSGDLAMHRKILCDQPRRGRPALPDQDLRDQIHMQWHDLKRQENMNEAQRYLALSERFPEVSMAALYAVVNEFWN
jgi:hypothetical protein